MIYPYSPTQAQIQQLPAKDALIGALQRDMVELEAQVQRYEAEVTEPEVALIAVDCSRHGLKDAVQTFLANRRSKL